MSSKSNIELATRKIVSNDDGDLRTIMAAPTEEQLSEMFGLPDSPNSVFVSLSEFMAKWNLGIDNGNLAGTLLMAIKKGWPYILCVTLDRTGEETHYTWSLISKPKSGDSGVAWQPTLLG